MLLAGAGGPLVLTSGNVSDEPIAYRDDDALARLACDRRRLPHPRPADPHAHRRRRHPRRGGPATRAAPGARIRARRRACLSRRRRPLLACGAELKSTFCVARDGRAWVSHHLGDLQDAGTRQSFAEGVEHFERLFAVAPGSSPTTCTRTTPPPTRSSATASRGRRPAPPRPPRRLPGRARRGRGCVGAIYDGSGFGADGTVWGGELLVGDARTTSARAFSRYGCPAATPRREPWRMACAWLAAAPTAAPGAAAGLAREVERRSGGDVRLAPPA